MVGAVETTAPFLYFTCTKTDLKMIRILYYNPDLNSIKVNLMVDDLPEKLREPDALIWVDFQGEPPEVCEPILLNTFSFHHLAVDDALQESHIPRVDDWGNYLYVVLAEVRLENNNGTDIKTEELDVFLGDRYLVTHHDSAIGALEKVMHLVQRDIRHLAKGADHLLYRLVDEMANDYMKVVDQLDEEIEKAEKEIFDHPTPPILEQTFNLKRALLHLRRLLSPQREVLNKLARDDFAMIDNKDRIYFRDVYDHMVRMHDITESLRDLVSGVLESYLSVVNNRMNDVMKTLTLITTLFMPISFIAGFFGMNFFEPIFPLFGWTGLQAFAGTLVLMAIMPAGMYLWMHQRGWM
jgi:magnesium transporter